MTQLLWKITGRFLTKVTTLSPCDPAISTLVTESNEPKTHVHTKTQTRIFTAVLLLIIAKTWKRPNCPPVSEG